jgi:exopolysaccharide biosynthesis polyprenyl glycosylphosphotransferase
MPLDPGRRRRALGEGGAIPEARPGGLSAARDAVYRRLLAVADIAAAATAIAVPVAVVGGHDLKPAVLLAPIALAVVCKAVGLYDRDQHLIRKTTLDETPTLFAIACFMTLAFWLAADAFVVGYLGRDEVMLMWVLLFAGLGTARSGARLAARVGATTERCLVIGDGEAAARVRDRLEMSHTLKANVVGRVPLDARGASKDGVPVLGTLQTLGLILVDHDVERAVIVPSESDSEALLDTIRLVKAMGVKVSVVPRLFEVVGSSVEFDDVDGVTLLGVRNYGLSKSSRRMKRAMDFAAAAMLLLLLLPLFAWIALAIKVTSRGRVLFHQARIGRAGTQFTMLKFRTMVDDADDRKDALRALNEADGLFKIADDPRITRVGGFLRRTSLDELPQLLNVLRGEMSLVGPRPLVPDEDRQIEGWHRRRHLSMPGITGLWQIFGSSRIPLHEMVKIDYLYGANWSMWLDIKILLRTVPYAIGRRGM